VFYRRVPFNVSTLTFPKLAFKRKKFIYKQRLSIHFKLQFKLWNFVKHRKLAPKKRKRIGEFFRLKIIFRFLYCRWFNKITLQQFLHQYRVIIDKWFLTKNFYTSNKNLFWPDFFFYSKKTKFNFIHKLNYLKNNFCTTTPTAAELRNKQKDTLKIIENLFLILFTSKIFIPLFLFIFSMFKNYLHWKIFGEKFIKLYFLQIVQILYLFYFFKKIINKSQNALILITLKKYEIFLPFFKFYNLTKTPSIHKRAVAQFYDFFLHQRFYRHKRPWPKIFFQKFFFQIQRCFKKSKLDYKKIKLIYKRRAYYKKLKTSYKIFLQRKKKFIVNFNKFKFLKQQVFINKIQKKTKNKSSIVSKSQKNFINKPYHSPNSAKTLPKKNFRKNTVYQARLPVFKKKNLVTSLLKSFSRPHHHVSQTLPVFFYIREMAPQNILWRVRFLPIRSITVAFIKYSLIYINFINIVKLNKILKQYDILFFRIFYFSFLARRRYKRLYEYFYVRHLPSFLEVSYHSFTLIIFIQPTSIDLLLPYTFRRLQFNIVIFGYLRNNPYLYNW
jgi:hypothetical protein